MIKASVNLGRQADLLDIWILMGIASIFIKDLIPFNLIPFLSLINCVKIIPHTCYCIITSCDK